jgi:hypothetical protein
MASPRVRTHIGGGQPALAGAACPRPRTGGLRGWGGAEGPRQRKVRSSSSPPPQAGPVPSHGRERGLIQEKKRGLAPKPEGGKTRAQKGQEEE